jgi:acetyl esterase
MSDLTTMDPRLAQLVGEVMAALPAEQPPAPPPAPAAGQDRADWLAEVAAARAALDGQGEIHAALVPLAGPEVGSVHDEKIEVEGGTITARIYTPSGSGPFPAIVAYHGGAWWLAGGEAGFKLTDGYCRRFCAGLDSVVVNVDYRLAPEYPYPHQLEDCYTALQWTIDQAATLRIDPANVSVMGGSSGGNQAAAVCLLARDRGRPAIKAQLLHVPGLDLSLESPSVREDPAVLAGLQAVTRLYATPEQVQDPYVSPLLAPDLSGLPPAVIVTGEFDFIRDDGRRYAERLRADGVEVRALEYPMLHNIALPETNEQMFAEMIAALGQAQSGLHLSEG